MKTLSYLIARNCKVYFRDKGVFFTSLMAPLILLFLFVAFLGNVYRDSIRSVAQGFRLSDALVESIAAGWLISSLLAVCAVTRTAFRDRPPTFSFLPCPAPSSRSATFSPPFS